MIDNVEKDGLYTSLIKTKFLSDYPSLVICPLLRAPCMEGRIVEGKDTVSNQSIPYSLSIDISGLHHNATVPSLPSTYRTPAYHSPVTARSYYTPRSTLDYENEYGPSSGSYREFTIDLIQRINKQTGSRVELYLEKRKSLKTR